MTARIYIETNSLIGYAQGRNLAIDRLMREPIAGAALMLPTPCVMEALSFLEWQSRQHRKFMNEGLRPKINECRRGVAWPDHDRVLERMNALRLTLEDVADRFTTRLYQALERIDSGDDVELIEPSRVALRRMRTEPVIDDPADNLVLWTILEHAAEHRGTVGGAIFHTEDKHFRDNVEARALLEQRGLRFESNPEAVLTWLTRPKSREDDDHASDRSP